MQIKINGKRVQMIRTVYVPAERTENGDLVKGTGRTKAGQVMSFPIHPGGFLHTQIPSEITVKRGVLANTKEFLTDDELVELNQWLHTQEELEFYTNNQKRWIDLKDDLRIVADKIMSQNIKVDADEMEEVENLFRTLKEAVRNMPVFENGEWSNIEK